jgi:hypothetical protein
MAYTYKAITTVWLVMMVLFALSASGSVTGRWVLLLAAAAFSAPMSLTLWPTARSSKYVLNEEGAQ